jgi:hypothetical protein
MKLHIIHGNRRAERLPLLLEQLQSQNITNYELWDGIYLPSIKAGINAAHKQIVEYAKIAEWPYVIIAEDDIVFSGKGSYDYFLDRMPEDFDLYLSMVYTGDPDENNIVRKFTGMTLYIVNERFYDVFLSVNPEEHIDVALTGLGKYVLCDKFVAYQRNGFSSNTGRSEVYDSLLAGREMFI